MSLELVLGAKAISARLGIHPKRLWWWVARGAPVRVVGEGRGRRYVANAEELSRWLRAGR